MVATDQKVSPALFGLGITDELAGLFEQHRSLAIKGALVLALRPHLVHGLQAGSGDRNHWTVICCAAATDSNSCASLALPSRMVSAAFNCARS